MMLVYSLYILCVHYKQSYGVMLLLFSCMLIIVHNRHATMLCMVVKHMPLKNK